MFKALLTAGLLAGLACGTAACSDEYGYGGIRTAYGYGYGYPAYYGWYGDYYYPGSGYYVYDRYRRPFRWNDEQRRYWESRRGPGRGYRDNWGGFAQNGYRYGQPQGRFAPRYRNDGYRVRSQPAVPGDAVSPAVRADRGDRLYSGPGYHDRGPRGDGQGGHGRGRH